MKNPERRDDYTWDDMPDGPLRDDRRRLYADNLEQDNSTVGRLRGKLDRILDRGDGRQQFHMADDISVRRWSDIYAEAEPEQGEPVDHDPTQAYLGIEHRRFGGRAKRPIDQYSVRLIMYGSDESGKDAWSTEATYDLQFGPDQDTFRAQTDRMLVSPDEGAMPVTGTGHPATEADLSYLTDELTWLVGDDDNDGR